ncbi:Rieske (2Fe-2S) protein [Mycobacterium yunnanensis]|uniref:Cytochrome bc1 complex Rieske iron-sulfur subunit n=1 Tax=Mycobacterium yunnanensis TaxID=368477 RepID=A0A9X3C2G0_9MYCO|nr:Rieske (2Fe-2S) protein [Mycobacterium yunnanensis]MCV7420232.1 Rieske (2Fe-2S) protein [Mycobacterium yunnanensis]
MLEHIRPQRRTVIVGAGVGALAAAVAACSSKDETATAESSSSPAASSSAAAAPGAALAKTADVPVGSGVIVDDVVITQATAGDFKGFSTVCPHAGCNVNKITDGKIICPCHDSEFNLDGSVAKGPAKKPLETKAVTVQGESIVAG